MLEMPWRRRIFRILQEQGRLSTQCPALASGKCGCHLAGWHRNLLDQGCVFAGWWCFSRIHLDPGPIIVLVLYEHKSSRMSFCGHVERGEGFYLARPVREYS